MRYQPGDTLASVERETIEGALKFYDYNKTQTARAIGCSDKTIATKLDQYAEDDRAAAEYRIKTQKAQQDELQRARGIKNETRSEDSETLKESAGTEIHTAQDKKKVSKAK